MANETNDIAGAISNLVNAATSIGQQQIELVTNTAKAVTDMAQPLTQTAMDLVGNLTNTLGQVVQNVASAIAPKQ